MDLFKKEGECDRAFIWRIGKAKEQGIIALDWGKITDIFNKELTEIKLPEEKLSSSTYRQQYRIVALYYEDVFKDIIDESNKNEDLVEQLEEIKKEKYKLFDQRKAYNKLMMGRARQEELNEIINETLEKMKINDDFNLNLVPDEKIIDYVNDETMLINIHDLHYGASFSNYWGEYNSDICKKRVANYLSRIIKIQKLHKVKKCVVACNGDLISGNIHQSIAVTNKEKIIEQIMGVSEVMTQFVKSLSPYFEQVSFAFVSGNHSRMARKDEAIKGERLDRIVPWYMQARLEGVPNISFQECENIDETMYLIEIEGKLYCGTHGEYDGKINKVLDIQAMIGRKIYAVLCGHLHHNKIDSSQGIKLIMSGSMQGIDDYCIENRIYGEAEQLICICDKNGLVCSYDINLK